MSRSVALLATLVLVLTGGPVIAQEGEGPVEIRRFAGEDRYETAVEVSRLFHEDHRGVRIAALANGETLVDALSIGPNMSRAREGFPTGPILLATRERLPEVTRAELERLAPCELIIMGGEAAISADVEDQAAQYVDAQQDKCT